MSDLEGSVVMITGASRGIGRSVARLAAARGARLGLVARSADDLDRVRFELEALAANGSVPNAHVVAPADVADRASVNAAVDHVVERLGPIDVLVNNAGIGAYSAVVETDPDVFTSMITVNYLGGCVWPTLAVLPGMFERRRGHVVNVASIAGRIGAPFEAAYSASKFAMVGFTESLAVEAAPFGVQVSLVDPGAVETEFFSRRGHVYARPHPKAISPERVAEAVVSIAVQDKAEERIVPGFLRPAYLVKTLVPALARWGTRRTFRIELDELVARVDARSHNAQE